MSPSSIDKQRVAHSFSKAAATYDDSAELQRDVGRQLLAQLPTIENAEVVVDLGCGTGFFTSPLQSYFPASHLLNIDLAYGMLQFAKARRSVENTSYLCADAEELPLKNNSVDLMFSSLAIQWCENLPQLFSEIARVLKPGGYFCFATLGPNTLHELRSAWQAADTYVHVNDFESEDVLKCAIASQSAQLQVQQFDEQLKILRYAQLKHLTDELKGIGGA